MNNHPSAPFTVIVRAYRLSPVVNVNERNIIYTSKHRSPHAAARRLATTFSRKSTLSVDIQRTFGKDFAGQYMIMTNDGKEYPLQTFQRLFC